MKKLSLALLILCLIILVAGCARQKKIIKPAVEPEMGKVEQEEPTPPEPIQPEPMEEEEVFTEPVIEEIVLEMIHFEFDKYRLLPQAKMTLEKNAEILKAHPDVKVIIEGHCDERGTIEYNLALGEKRANSARKYLIDLGVGADRLSTISYGKERPLDSRSNQEAWAKNRRAELTIVE